MPWRRLIRDWVMYLGVMIVVFVVVFRDRVSAGTTAGLMASGPLFVGLGAVLAKFGYTRKTLKQLRSEAPQREAEAQARRATDPARSGSRNRPAPTKRTSTGPQHRPTSKRKRS